MELLHWLNAQLLRMQWLSDLVAWLLQSLGLDPASRIGGSVHFFIYDTIKIFLLLAVLIFAVSWVRAIAEPRAARAGNTVGACWAR
ncbi:hypothetical protein [Thermomonas sp.]|uniref:hypothetical protein n=1 Tax=Thermomonas sp. TaxID=1971895 RepID=UPI00262560DB|nr:hypothetical protein [Thermomonas sp.]